MLEERSLDMVRNHAQQEGLRACCINAAHEPVTQPRIVTER